MAQNCYDNPYFEESCGCTSEKDRKDDITIKSLDDIVKDYKKLHYDNLEVYLEGLNGKIHNCVFGPIKNYKKHPHQRRISRETLDNAVCSLEKKKEELAAAKTFPELYAIVEGIEISGYGLLARYDFAIRYGFNKDIAPEEVYLHSGTLEGAKAVLPEKKRLRPGDVIKVKELPKPLQKLNGLHLENLLCIYKKELKRIKNG